MLVLVDRVHWGPEPIALNRKGLKALGGELLLFSFLHCVAWACPSKMTGKVVFEIGSTVEAKASIGTCWCPPSHMLLQALTVVKSNRGKNLKCILAKLSEKSRNRTVSNSPAIPTLIHSIIWTELQWDTNRVVKYYFWPCFSQVILTSLAWKKNCACNTRANFEMWGTSQKMVHNLQLP